MYYVNDGVFGSFNCVISYNLINVPIPLKLGSCECYSSIVWGQTCDSKDKLCETDMPEQSIGDWLYFDNMGGYTVGVASTFNGFSIPVKFHYITERYRYMYNNNISSSVPRNFPGTIIGPTVLPMVLKFLQHREIYVHCSYECSSVPQNFLKLMGLQY